MIGLIKKLLGINRMKGKIGQLEENMGSLNRQVENITCRQEDISKVVTRVEPIKRRQIELEGKLRALGKRNLEMEQKTGEIFDLLQQVRNTVSKNCHPVQKGNIQKCESRGIKNKIKNLPDSLKGVVKALFNADSSCTYQGLARKLSKKPATIRSYIYRLKERDFPLEFLENSGSKKRVKLPIWVKRKLTVPDDK